MIQQQVPLWVAIVIAVGTPLLAFAGALIGQLLSRKGAKEQDVQWHREETMRILRWAAELAADSDAGQRCGRRDLGRAGGVRAAPGVRPGTHLGSARRCGRTGRGRL